ncbi:MAG TPA: UDP-3-O-(3-hydroxymyristoyl)glucosamine N-acyltransferase [Vicinamibacterales bacterium]|nr:UDP-3-O-(3-hydroxymyristoyl)glucosamine N-acyltransferase [Vicinamibacterales bacterium]
MKVSELARHIGGELVGDGSVDVTGVSPVDDVKPGHVTFADTEQYFARAEASGAAAIVVAFSGPASSKPLIRVKKTTPALAKILGLFHPPQRPEAGVHPTAFVGRDVRLGKGVHVGANAVVKDGASIGDRSVVDAGAVVGERVMLGDDCFIHGNATLYHDVRLGNRVVVHSGTVVGSDGFGYTQDGRTRVKIPQVGTVVIEDDVEIGANAAIDRSTLGATVIRRGTKIDNLVQIAHNVVIGEDTVICGLVGVSGSVTIAGQVGMADHITIGSNTTVGAQSGVSKSLEGGQYYLGSPAVPIGLASRQYAVWANLPELSKRVRELEKRLADVVQAFRPASKEGSGPESS